MLYCTYSQNKRYKSPNVINVYCVLQFPKGFMKYLRPAVLIDLQSATFPLSEIFFYNDFDPASTPAPSC